MEQCLVNILTVTATAWSHSHHNTNWTSVMTGMFHTCCSNLTQFQPGFTCSDITHWSRCRGDPGVCPHAERNGFAPSTVTQLLIQTDSADTRRVTHSVNVRFLTLQSNDAASHPHQFPLTWCFRGTHGFHCSWNRAFISASWSLPRLLRHHHHRLQKTGKCVRKLPSASSVEKGCSDHVKLPLLAEKYGERIFWSCKASIAGWKPWTAEDYRNTHLHSANTEEENTSIYVVSVNTENVKTWNVGSRQLTKWKTRMNVKNRHSVTGLQTFWFCALCIKVFVMHCHTPYLIKLSWWIKLWKQTLQFCWSSVLITCM